MGGLTPAVKFAFAAEEPAGTLKISPVATVVTNMNFIQLPDLIFFPPSNGKYELNSPKHGHSSPENKANGAYPCLTVLKSNTRNADGFDDAGPRGKIHDLLLEPVPSAVFNLYRLASFRSPAGGSEITTVSVFPAVLTPLFVHVTDADLKNWAVAALQKVPGGRSVEPQVRRKQQRPGIFYVPLDGLSDAGKFARINIAQMEPFIAHGYLSANNRFPVRRNCFPGP